ncbi:response regulator [Pseudomonas prosekii]|nr:response regulator [Pseudomonas prosekii]
MLLEEALAEIGFSSAAFDNTTEALAHLISLKGVCSLIIVDQGLPRGIQGIELIHIANERWPVIPSILTSGDLVDEQVIPPSATYLQKPYNLDQLEQAITAVMQ